MRIAICQVQEPPRDCVGFVTFSSHNTYILIVNEHLHNMQCYVIITVVHSSRLMHDYDCEFIWDYEVSCHDFVEERYSNDDEDYAPRTDNNYERLAERHYA